MRVSKEQAAENRERILGCAAQLFRERGFDGIGVADLMKAAGFTHGGFYGHFSSKEDLMAQAVARARDESATDWNRLEAEYGKHMLQPYLAHYLSASHRDNPGKGCVMAALAAASAHQGAPVRAMITAGIRRFVAGLARLVKGQDELAKRQQAITTLAAMVGALVLARAADDTDFSDEILQAVRERLGSIAAD
ncbi:MAG: TetR family transcriptional regulator [Candidatus Dactylopiibacterium carminicum]|uniref:TetR family transcriptional regulator n=1 Tax=Candidatus Dactylopiibacterium carminicum TaxID=857335 RepID=A0A272EST8_9RHOO|nr:TetR/AcrR family transcriptional regulator [Candidatus Dactylopiibacterium carminicum]KAF7598874.1 TetR/AcrR family transcriptional regulator [Candidatus Dactylopiibacterium carminicum]PAS92790.1 MAG: TetR family transcriptional regulator [Candidatus Dactylopiibacterium carminicum]PAS96239.1 MAG: TetR family transcriptional regulator [Candidatus Dactylopiibacterium carminicum]PAS98890.1 MAG: hypothetical protein BSR46_11050 [Candidatus Dactylopiibacterium carminicum]